jgi:hypothetical protein
MAPSLQLLAHRRTVSAERPSLPSQAGKALARFDVRSAQLRAFLAALRTAPRGRKGSPRKTEPLVFPVVKPEVSLDGLARLVVAIANEQMRKAAEQRGQ